MKKYVVYYREEVRCMQIVEANSLEEAEANFEPDTTDLTFSEENRELLFIDGVRELIKVD